MAEGGSLLNCYTGKPVSWVRIPSPPPLTSIYCLKTITCENSPTAEIEQLRGKVVKLNAARDILKKATTYFAKQSVRPEGRRSNASFGYVAKHRGIWPLRSSADRTIDAKPCSAGTPAPSSPAFGYGGVLAGNESGEHPRQELLGAAPNRQMGRGLHLCLDAGGLAVCRCGLRPVLAPGRRLFVEPRRQRLEQCFRRELPLVDADRARSPNDLSHARRSP